MKNVKFYKVLILSSLCVFILSASKNYSSDTKVIPNIGTLTDTVTRVVWMAPQWADTVKNKLPFNAETIAKGDELYSMYCFSCHGDTGYGDGPAGGSMGVKPANFHDPKIQKQKDGSLFWKLSNGKGNMPPFKEALNEEQRWQLVVFLRELGKSE
jgi:mono/diheme cytochrome c family protein